MSACIYLSTCLSLCLCTAYHIINRLHKCKFLFPRKKTAIYAVRTCMYVNYVHVQCIMCISVVTIMTISGYSDV